MLVQIVFRVFTFATNALLLRYISSELLGVINVRLTLLYSTSTFLGWEAFRRAVIGTKERHKWRQAINLSWLCVPVSVTVSSLLGWAWLRLLATPSSESTNDQYAMGVVMTIFIVWAESLAQPAFMLAQAMMLYKTKLLAEMMVLTCRVLLKAWLIVTFPDRGAIWAYCVSHCLAALSLLIVYYGGLAWQLRHAAPLKHSQLPITKLFEISPAKGGEKMWLDSRQVSLVSSFWRQGVLKQLLTEGERYLMTVLQLLSFSEQGVYDVVAALGSLAARLVLQPVEENAYVFFSRHAQRGQPISAKCSAVIFCLLRLLLVFGAMAASLGPSFAHLVLWLYGGPSLADQSHAVILLRAHCICVPLLAVNGILECFTFAAMLDHQVDKYNRKMVALSVCFLLCACCFTRLCGSVGFVLANCVNMLCRIVICCRFVSTMPKGDCQTVAPLSALRFPAPVLACHLAVALAASVSEYRLYGQSVLAHLSTGVFCFLVLAAVHWVADTKLRRSLRAVLAPGSEEVTNKTD